MSFELGEAIRRSGLEKRGRRAVLDALACYTDQETGLARVSHVTLALHAGLSERTVARVLDALVGDPDMEGLVRCVRPASGRGNPAVYKVDLARLEPLASAIKIAGRRVFAGVGKRLCDAGLVGAKATPDNIRACFSALLELLAEEGEATTVRTVEALRDEFEAAMQRRAEISVVGRPLDAGTGGEGVADGAAGPVEDDGKPRQNVHLSAPGKVDILSGKVDILSTGHNKESSPSGNIPLARAPAREAGCGKILAGAAVQAGAFLFDAEGLLAHATISRSERRQLMADLQGRLARITPDGVLAIRVRNESDAEAMQARWLEALLRWAGDVGLAGVVFDGRSPEPSAAPALVEG